MRSIAARRWVRIGALLSSGYILALLSLLLAYFAECGLPELWDWRWQQCVTARWDLLPNILRQHWALAPLPVLFWVLVFAVKLGFMLGFLWLFVTTRWGRQFVLTMGILFTAWDGLVRELTVSNGTDFAVRLASPVLLLPVLIAGVSYITLRHRLKGRAVVSLAVGIWVVGGLLVMLNQPVALGLLLLVADPALVLTDMRLSRSTEVAVLSALFFAFHYVLQPGDQMATSLLGLVILSTALLPALCASSVNRNQVEMS